MDEVCFPPMRGTGGQHDAHTATLADLHRRLLEMSEIIREGARWTGNEIAYGDKTESDIAMLDDILTDALRLSRATHYDRNVPDESCFPPMSQLDTTPASVVGGVDEAAFQHAWDWIVDAQDPISAEWLRSFVAAYCSCAETTTLSAKYSDMLRKICFEYSAGGYNSEGLMAPEAADAKIRWVIAEAQGATEPDKPVILLAGVQALCVGASQEYARCKGVLSSWDAGFFAGQLFNFDTYTSVDKTAVAQACEYLEKLTVATESEVNVPRVRGKHESKP